MTAANPNGPRAKLVAESRRIRRAILDALEDNDGIGVRQICHLVGGEPQPMRQRLARMISEGELHSVIVPVIGAPFMALYFLGPDECRATAGKEASQRTVSKWKPPTIKHDPLHTAFFGAKQQQGE